ncbi:MAG: nucleoside-diphosphate kinase [Chloroflexi bacterium]|nr:nucleoside-diphosphate kinase [Chloroflexota bacterium]
MERTLVLIKPDGVQRALVGEITARFERRGLRLVGLKLIQMSKDLAEDHYGEHKDRPFFPGLVSFITSGPVVAMVLEGPGAILMVRDMMGKTKPAESAPGTIRGDYGVDVGRNIIHGSDGAESAAAEIQRFFSDSELIDWERSLEPWIIE